MRAHRPVALSLLRDVNEAGLGDASSAGIEREAGQRMLLVEQGGIQRAVHAVEIVVAVRSARVRLRALTGRAQARDDGPRVEDVDGQASGERRGVSRARALAPADPGQRYN